MNKKIAMALVLTVVSGSMWADETTDQIKAQIQKVEKRVDGLEKGAKQTQPTINMSRCTWSAASLLMHLSN
jgi:tetrahydromethanopterin S-methyltransferase subunit B